MREMMVCTMRWNGVKSESFTWRNPDPQNDVTFKRFGTSWPFTLRSGFKVKAGSTRGCALKGIAGQYRYTADPCKTKGNPKTVVIS
jgi:hypothetical protein